MCACKVAVMALVAKNGFYAYVDRCAFVLMFTGTLSCQCFAGMLINFRSGEFLELRHDNFSKGHAEFFRENRDDDGSNRFSLVSCRLRWSHYYRIAHQPRACFSHQSRPGARDCSHATGTCVLVACIPCSLPINCSHVCLCMLPV